MALLQPWPLLSASCTATTGKVICSTPTAQPHRISGAIHWGPSRPLKHQPLCICAQVLFWIHFNCSGRKERLVNVIGRVAVPTSLLLSHRSASSSSWRTGNGGSLASCCSASAFQRPSPCPGHRSGFGRPRARNPGCSVRAWRRTMLQTSTSTFHMR